LATHDETPEPTEEELKAALEDQMRRIRVEDVVLQTVATLVNVGARRLGLTGEPEEKELEQARLAIDASRALVPMCPSEQLEPIKQALSQLQMAYAREAGAPSAVTGQGESPGAVPQSPAAEDEPKEQGSEDEERAKARSKIWTPPGA
jgi:hypothetical protein